MIAAARPHHGSVMPIVAAASLADRRTLAELAERARFRADILVAEPAELADLLRAGGAAWVMTGGTVEHALPFVEAARSAQCAVVAVLSGNHERDDVPDLRWGGVAVLRASPERHVLRAAVTASRAGLSMWHPGVDRRTAEAQRSASVTPLSPRERSVLEAAGAGLSNKAIARRLGISPNTVKFHLQAAFAKLGVASRAEAVMSALRRGELSI